MLAANLAHREVAPLLSDDRFPVDGTLVKARASMKSFQTKTGDTPPDGDPGSPPGPDPTAEDHPEPTPSEIAPMPRPTRRNRNAEVDFRGEKRANATHASTTDPDARLYKKSPGTGAMPCFMGHALMDMRRVPPPVRGTCRLRNGLIVQGELTRADGHAERRAALDPRHGHSDQWRADGSIHRHSPGSTRRLTLGADKGFDAEFVADLRPACVTPHVARDSPDLPRSTAAPPATRAMPRRAGTANGSACVGTTIPRDRRPILLTFGWARTLGHMAQTVCRGIERARSRFILTMVANTLARLPRLLAA